MKPFVQNALIAVALLGSTSAFAQYPLVNIADIQTVPTARLSNCDDAPARLNDTVRVQGVVLTPGGLAQSASGRQIWIRDINGPGPFRTLGIRYGGSGATTPVDILNLFQGDTVEITGIVQEFNGSQDGETQINPLASGVNVIAPYVAGSPLPAPTVLPIGVLNNNQRQNILTTGEQYEGEFIEIQNVTVTAVSFFGTGNSRVSFDVVDAAGNKINVSDRFLAQRLPGGSPAGTFVAPQVGDVFTAIRGIVIHNKQCPTTGQTNRGYELNPFNASHYVKGASGPAITSLSNLPVVPATTDAVTITANITGGTDGGGQVLNVSSATLFYSPGLTGAYQSTPMTNASGSIWQATLPANVFADGTYVRYYVTANNSASQSVTFPNVGGTPAANPQLFLVRNGSLNIRDVQYTPFQTGGNQSTGAGGHANSIFAGQNVTIEGVVTASSEPGNLGFYYIQQENQTEYAGLWVNGGSLLTSFVIGDKIRVTGTIEEYFNWTRMTAVTAATKIGTGTITPIVLNPDVLQTQNFQTSEKYESMLVTIQAPSGPVFVVDTNADSPSYFGEWRIGTDMLDENRGTRVFNGRVGTSYFSSLNVTYVPRVPPSSWNSTLNGTPIIIKEGDQFTSVTGVVQYTFNNFKLAPRNNPDLVGYVSEAKSLVNRAGFKLYPNPANTQVGIQIDQPTPGMQAIITDLAGRTVATKANLTGTDAMDISQLTPGTYVVTVANAAGTAVSRTKLAVVK